MVRRNRNNRPASWWRLITETHYNEIQKASIIIILGLFLCLVHKYIPKDIIYTFPFLDTTGGYEDWCFSFNPEKPLTHPLRSTISILLDGIFVILYIPAIRIVGDMRFPISIPYFRVFNYDIWTGLVLFEVLKRVDLILSYRHLPFRTWAILFLIIAQLYYLHYAERQVVHEN